MFYFLIPLRSKESSKDWNIISKLFNNTITSVCNQIDPDFKIIIAYHDLPEIDNVCKKHLELIKVPYPSPENYDQQMLDKYYKKRFMMERVRAYGGGYVMFMDADDLISNRITEYINKDDNRQGYYINKGYEYNLDTSTLKIAPKFHKLCGSSYIIYYRKDELPHKAEFLGYSFKNDDREKKYLFDYSHNIWNSLACKQSKYLKPIPFKGAIYVINTGDNHSQLTGNVSNKRKIFRKLTLGRNVNQKIGQEFSL